MPNILKKIVFILKINVIVLAVAAALLNWQEIKKLYYNIFDKLPEISKTIRITEKEILENIKREINTPPPLRAKIESAQAYLTAEGVIRYTNLERQKNGLPPLAVNLLLNNSAAIKVEDMFANQYFGHDSPDGKNVDDLAESVGYEFIVIGENLAMGNFLNDEVLVQGWMNSPGHRENILNSKYREIGVAVLKGIYQGKSTWMAVQHFGLALTACPQPSKILLEQIKTNETLLVQMEEELLNKKTELEAASPKRRDEYSNYIALVEEYNNLVEQYNQLVAETKSLIDQYNKQIALFNQCAS
ncbi:hypothetical protein A3J78_01020 [Candidatus Beckwithbacteria bacterium RBG_13_35_6]|uniref:SCP domain-containing protein n=1 Tax=Candidatus Beckwithbacteria bacterium RBG_13_35_6 TaxID=1797456 RepID=A0A1F5DD65_9BACT|nr:MAG: hypothetical protein A3J78_01020 [Candidatus Beckwithbacteria bacterium RBG_13_35_6]